MVDADINNTPPVDVAPVRHGKWLHEELITELMTEKNVLECHTWAECSECHKVRIVDNYCPNCGAKMDL